jgi:hypothetical protein
MLKRRWSASLLFVVIPLLAAAPAVQQPDIAGLSDFPAPPWPADGKVPPELKETYVFVDLAKNEYVVAYPENLGTEAFAKDPGPLRINRYDLLRNVSPAVSVAIAPVPNSAKFKYTYTVANASSAKQSIDQYILVLPQQAGRDAIQHPDGWFGIVQTARSFKVKNPEWIRTGAAAIWSFQKPEQVIQPGGSKTGFELESELRPGFTVGFFRRATSVDARVATHGNVPKEVKEQIDQILAVEYNSRTMLTLGPKFDKSADDKAVAEDFIQGIFTLSRAGVLELNSEFVRNTLNELTGIQPGGKASGIKLGSARTPAESEILNALRISLRLN